MLIYRYENKDGRGPFTFSRKTESEIRLYYAVYKKIRYDTHPGPDWEKYTEKAEDYFFGCSSLEQLEFWFDDYVQKHLIDAGFKIKVYGCPDEYCVEDKNQIGFIMNKAEDITEYILV